MKGFVIAGTGSGSGKTTITLGILAYLSKLGYKVAPFKVGPDFIDPGHHTAITGKISRNLDSWMLSRETNQKIFDRGCGDSRDNFAKGCRDSRDNDSPDNYNISTAADIAVVEGVMGLFDGYSGTSEAGSTAQMSKWLNLPVVLVVDARSMARSAAAIVQGFENFDPEVKFAGVIFSKTGSLRHYDYLKEAVEANCKMPCLGHIPRTPEIAMPERHLGLVTSDEHKLSSDLIGKIIDIIDKNTSIKSMVENLLYCQTTQKKKTQGKIAQHNRIKIAVARDKAFCFYYQENIEALERYGAEIVAFSPIQSPALPSDISGIYLGGGYPELFAQELCDNKSLIQEIRQNSLRGMPIYGECGGFMYLCSTITITGMNENSTESDKALTTELSKSPKRYPMTGCFPFVAVMSKKMRSLGYRQITLRQDTVIGKKGDVLRGHEFHYSSLEDENSNTFELKQVYQTTARNGQEITLNGYQINNTLGSYLHVHFESMECGAAEAFVDACRKFYNLSSKAK
ncbi:MAG: cobyrinate a,c-diamide synthase [Desulfamplus sp.]